MSNPKETELIKAALDFAEDQRIVNTYLERAGGVPDKMQKTYDVSRQRMLDAARAFDMKHTADDGTTFEVLAVLGGVRLHSDRHLCIEPIGPDLIIVRARDD